MQAVVVGGGVVGLASAYFLRERGVAATVVEQSSLASGSTGRANGGIRAQFSTRVNVALSRESIAFWETIADDIDYRQAGYLFLARTRGTADRLRENVALQRERGVPSGMLDPGTAAEVCPELHADRYVAASHCPTDGSADPHLAANWFAREAADAGADLRTGVEVTDVVRDGDRVAGVETTDGSLSADVVVNAAGPWAAEVAAMAGVKVPVAPKRRQLAVVEPERPLPRDVPLTADLDAGVHFRPERAGRAVVGGKFDADDPDCDPDGYRRSHDLDWAADALDAARDCTRYFGPDTRLRDGWAGLYAVTPDHHPIIEESLPGFVQAIGFSGHGFMHAPATGRVVAELVADGRAATVDVSMLGSDRFDGGSPLAEDAVLD
jgi:sarcosine oxidase subunit beta